MGENPFLTSLNQAEAWRHVDQLDVEDGLVDGTPVAWARATLSWRSWSAAAAAIVSRRRGSTSERVLCLP